MWWYLALAVLVAAGLIIGLLIGVASSDAAAEQADDEWREMFGGEWDPFK